MIKFIKIKKFKKNLEKVFKLILKIILNYNKKNKTKNFKN
jgi:hypothetical protein